MTQNGAGEAEIEERVKQALARVKHERSAQPVFTPHFLARMKRTLVFRPLSEPAMIGVTRKLAKQVQTTWQQKREQTLQIDEQLLIAIGQTAHTQNQKSGHKEGGRLVRKLLSETIETPAQQQLLKAANSGRGARTIRVARRTTPGEGNLTLPAERAMIAVDVTFE